MALTKVIGAGLGEVTESSSLTYANSQASIVVQDDTNPNIVINDTGQSKDYFIVANGSQLAFNYADGGGSSSASNVTQLMSMDNSGAITKPNQPAFLATKTSNANNFTTGSQQDITFTTEVYDQNADFASSIFTAPVTGKYYLKSSIYLSGVDTAVDYYAIRINTSNRVYIKIFTPKFTADVGFMSMEVSTVADMDASDTAKIQIIQSAGTAQTDIQGNAAYTFFTGYLVA